MVTRGFRKLVTGSNYLTSGSNCLTLNSSYLFAIDGVLSFKNIIKLNYIQHNPMRACLCFQ